MPYATRSSSKSYDLQNDYVTWSIRDSFTRSNPLDRSTEMLVYRVTMVNFTAIHTTTLTVTNLLFDLLGSPRASEFYAGLREEAERLLRDYNGVWTKVVVAKAIRLDSTIRETMRLSSFLGRGLERKVVSNESLTLEDGCHLPRGTKSGVSVYSTHHDEGFYAQAYE